MISSVPAVETCVTTGATFSTWGSLARISATLIGMGAPVSPLMNEDPEASRSRRPRCPRSRAAVLEHPHAKADDQQDERDFERHGHNADQRAHRPMHQIPDDHAIHHVFKTGRLTLLAIRSLRRRNWLSEMHNIRAGWLLQRELVVGQRLINFQFDHVQGNVVSSPAAARSGSYSGNVIPA
jgi:hypothetical protein